MAVIWSGGQYIQVQKGSTLGSLLFLICIDDLVSKIHSNIKLFAHDTTFILLLMMP